MAYNPKYFLDWQNVPFSIGYQNYDPQLAWWLAQCSQLSYENKITVATELKNANFNQVTFFDNQGTQAFLAVHPGVQGGGKFAILAFRGTEQDSIDILTDIDFVRRLFPSENLVEEPSQTPEASQKTKPTSTDKFYAHGGFLQGVLNIWGSALQQEISRMEQIHTNWTGNPGLSEAMCELGKEIPLYFTGHSLGGALATLAAYKALVYQSSINLTALYTFGSPRTAQAPLARGIDQALAGKLYRVVNHQDVVPRLPPRVPVILSFYHIDKLIYYNKNRQRQTLSKPEILLGDIGVLALTVLQVILSFLSFKKYTPGTIAQHMIAEYIKDINKDRQTST